MIHQLKILRLHFVSLRMTYQKKNPAGVTDRGL